MSVSKKTSRQIFEDIDKDKSGFLTFFEFKTFLRNNGINTGDKEINQFMESLDNNGDKKINIQEFADYVLKEGS